MSRVRGIAWSLKTRARQVSNPLPEITDGVDDGVILGFEAPHALSQVVDPPAEQRRDDPHRS
jgi:hypothetical protein